MPLTEWTRRNMVLLESETAVRLLEEITDMEPIIPNERWDEYQAKWKAYEEAIQRYRESLPSQARCLVGAMEEAEKRHGKYSKQASEVRERFLVYMRART
jgi:chromosome segregation ATPase